MKTQLKSYFITGLIALMPLAIVLLVVSYIYKFLFGLLGWLPSFDLPYGLGLVFNLLILIAFILLVGFVTAEIFKGYYKNIDGFFLKLPIIGKFYGSVRQITDSLYGKDRAKNFKRVVIVEYPRKKIYSLGFVIKDKEVVAGEDRLAVFIPTSPLPMSGMLIYVSKSEVIETKINVDDAIKLIFSGGFVGKGE